MNILTPTAQELVDLGHDEFMATLAGMAKDKRAPLIADAVRIRRLREFPYPSALGVRIEPDLIRTPMIELLDGKMLEIAKAIEVMQQRQRRRRSLLSQGVEDKRAIEQAADEIPAAGLTRLIVSAPPQEGKSYELTRFGIEWLLMRYPWLNVAIVSYDLPTAGQFSYLIREDIRRFDGENDEFDMGLRLAPDQRAVNRFSLTTKGSIYSIGITGGITSRHVSAMVIDDAVKDIRAAESILQAQQAAGWWQTSGRPRLAPWAPVMVVMTAWDEHDLRGQLIAKAKAARDAGVENFDDWQVVNIPAQADHDPSTGSDILGREPGEYLQSARGRTVADWEQTKFETGPRYWNAMYQGNPTPSTGNILHRTWWRRYSEPLWSRTLDGTYRVRGYTLTQSWDFTFKDLSTSDFVVGQVWAKKGADSFLIYQARARLSFVDTLTAIRRVTWLFPGATAKYYEDAANGPAIKSSLQHEISGLIPVTVKTSKTARAEAASPVIQGGNIYLPSVEVASMNPDLFFDVEAFIDEATAFPFGAHDDQVDACLVAGTRILTRDGERPIQDIREGDVVRGHSGWVEVTRSWKTGVESVITRYGLTGTANHPIWTERGWVGLGDLRDDDRILVWDANTQGQQSQKASSLTGSSFGAIPTPRKQVIGATTSLAANGSRRASRLSIKRYGSFITDLFHQGITSITSMATGLTTELKTWSVSRAINMRPSTLRLDLVMVDQLNNLPIWKRSGISRRSGTVRQRDVRGILFTESVIVETLRKPTAHRDIPMMRKILAGIEMGVGAERVIVPTFSRVSENERPVAVFNLSTTDETYFANGILVHNCTQYVKEKYLDHGTSKIHSPVGRTVRVPDNEPQTEMARRIAARKESV